MSRPFSLAEIQQVIGGEIVGNRDLLIFGVAGLEEAGAQELSFLANPRYASHLAKTAAGAVIIPPDASLPPSGNAIKHENPSLAFQKLIEAYKKTLPPMSHFKGIHPLAFVAEGVALGLNVTISPFAVIEKGAKIGDGTFVGSHTYVGPQATVGKECWIHPHVTLREGVIVGDRVILQPGAVIGSCGFGYLTDGEGKHKKLDQLGNVTLGDDVEIGANTTIDRARFATTDIGAGTKVDNLVQIAHNVWIGKHCILVSGTAVAGSSKLEDHVILMGRVAVNGHLTIVSQTRVAACGVVQKTIRESGDYGGFPLVPIKTFHRNYVVAKELGKRIQDLEKEVYGKKSKE
jgi:UDP-3-O-[3-hydroxymyristoyl] glucosamine N-acyltransferase